MSIYGVGVDLVRIERIEKALERWGDRFERRIFTQAESEACTAGKSRVSRLAMRFAAKEAFAKALGTGIRGPVQWREIEVANDSLGKPLFLLSSAVLNACSEHGVRSWHLSMTDDGEYAQAFVVLES
jgi:holo-[acyl-carrier protein] synthase